MATISGNWYPPGRVFTPDELGATEVFFDEGSTADWPRYFGVDKATSRTFTVSKPRVAFKVGDKVIGNSRNTYNITNIGWTGKIVSVETGTDNIEVEGKGFMRKIERWWVNGREFDLYQNEKDNWEELRKLFKH